MLTMSDSCSNSSKELASWYVRPATPRGRITSYPHTSASNPTVNILATWPPILPASPIIPIFFPCNSRPINSFLIHLPSFISRSAKLIVRNRDSIRPTVNSATLTVGAPGVLRTLMPASLAALRSILSSPTPALPMILRFRATLTISASILVRPRTITISYSGIFGRVSLYLSPLHRQPETHWTSGDLILHYRHGHRLESSSLTCSLPRFDRRVVVFGLAPVQQS